MSTRSLEGKTIAVFAAYGAIGSVVTKTLAEKGATLLISGRDLDRLDELRVIIEKTGSHVYVQQIDATDEKQVREAFESWQQNEIIVDGVFNAIGSRMLGIDQVKPACETSVQLFKKYFDNMVVSQFITSREASRIMQRRGKGSIVMMGATPARGQAALITGPSVAHAAVEGMARCLATEWGPLGIRVNCVMSSGIIETPNIQEVLAGIARETGASQESIQERVKMQAALRRSPTTKEIAEVVSFLFSKNSSALTGAILNASCGSVLD